MGLLSNHSEGKAISGLFSVTSLRFDTLFGRKALGVWITLASIFMVRATLGYRPFPSVDDFAYIPLAINWLDPTTFSRDELLTHFGNHQVIYAMLVALGKATVGLPYVFFAATLILTALTIVAIARILRTLDADAYLLPLVIALGISISIRGLGRGSYDGLLGDGVHGQWIAIVLSLFAFDYLLRGRHLATGILLGFAVYAQAMVAFHSAFAIFIAGMFVGRRGVVDIFKAGIAAVAISLPFLVSVGSELLVKDTSAAVVDWTAVVSSYQFRAPHHYDLKMYPIAITTLIVAVGFASWSRFGEVESQRDRSALGLLTGLSLLFFSAVAFYAIFPETLSAKWLVAADVLDLTRSSPLLFGLSAMFFAIAFDRHLAGARKGSRLSLVARLSWLILLCAVAFLVIINTAREFWVYFAIVLGVVTMVALRWGRAPMILGPIWLLAGVVAASGFFSQVNLRAPVDQDEAGLYRWVKASTPSDALFIVPPGFSQFRAYTTRGVYVDFKLASMAQPHLLDEWMRRMIQVSSPDKLGRNAKGWKGIMTEWNRTYASRNSPQRVAGLLQDTGADFFLLDRDDLKIPPFVDRPVESAPGLDRAFENTRFIVYRLRG